MSNRYSLNLICFYFLLACFTYSQNNERGYIVSVGDKAPLFKTKTSSGEIFDLEKHKGKIVMLQFTASWCSVCIKEMPYIENEIWQIHKDSDDFLLVGIDKGESIEMINKLINKTNVTYPICLDEKSEIFELYAEKKAGVTRNVIINRDGEIIFLTRLFDHNEFNEMKDIISKSLTKN
tara:strand:- start:646 stop:1179 length:534 start_codon:yes stop_codon:yes gene_type:complete